MARLKTLAALLCAAALLVCQSAKVKEPVAKVGRTTLGSESLESFSRAATAYPVTMPYYFPAQRQIQTIMVECEAIYQRAGAKSAEISKRIAASPDWAWKRRYYASLLFFDLLVDNLGFTDKQLEDYYKKSAEAFRVTVKTDAGQDSSYVPPFDSIKTQVADHCFYNTYKPDSAFIAGLSDRDSVAVMNHWIYTVRSESNRNAFFMRLFFKERTGSEYADSLEQLVGDGKILTEADMDVITNWLPESRKDMRKTELAEYLFKWLAFSERAEKLGLTATPQFKRVLHWAQRLEFAFEYLRTEVLPNLEPAGAPTALDSALAELIVHDNRAFYPQRVTFAEAVTEALDEIAKTRISVAVDSAIFAIRKGAKIKFLQDDRRDDKDADVTALMAKADSLREAASDPDMDIDEAAKIMKDAERLYHNITMDFAFTATGRKAFGELAKTLIDMYNANPRQGEYLVTLAIIAYRKSQKLDTDPEALCNSYFLTGFAYDEYLKNYSSAEANYKWVLRNAPTCALASDAEFMIQHLGEPMTSIEEIQGQSLRQGREVDFDEGAEASGVL